jgi:hypothetical protein
MAVNKDRPIIQSHGYNGSEPTRICPHCGKEKPLSEFGFRKMQKGEQETAALDSEYVLELKSAEHLGAKNVGGLNNFG